MRRSVDQARRPWPEVVWAGDPAYYVEVSVGIEYSDREVLTDVLALVLKTVGQMCKPTIGEYICCTGQQRHRPYILLSSFYNHRMPTEVRLVA